MHSYPPDISRLSLGTFQEQQAVVR